MKYTQKLTMARQNVEAYIPTLAETVNSLGFKEVPPHEDRPAMYMSGPVISYVRSEVEKLSSAEVTFFVASFAIMFQHVMDMQKSGVKFDDHINMLAMTVFSSNYLKDFPEHAFKGPEGQWVVPPGTADGKTIEDIYKELQTNPGIYGERCREGIEEYQRERMKEFDQEEQEKLQPWLDS